MQRQKPQTPKIDWFDYVGVAMGILLSLLFAAFMVGCGATILRFFWKFTTWIWS